MIDCHSHLSSHDFDEDREAVLARAMKAGVSRIAVVGQDYLENREVLELTRRDKRLFGFLGLHPDRFDDRSTPITIEEIEKIIGMIREFQAEITGIGEVGLDYWVCREDERRELQREAFRKMVVLAIELDLPLNVHSRSSGHYVIDLLLDEGAEKVLLHAFDGKASHALRGAEAGFIFSIPPSIVRSEQKQKLVKALPLNALALETDSPVLGPERGIRNEPANLTISAAEIASIKGITEEEVRRRTTENARRLFGLNE